MEERNTNGFSSMDIYWANLESLAAARTQRALSVPFFFSEYNNAGLSDPRNHFTSFAQLAWLDAIHSIRNATSLEQNTQLDPSFTREINTFEREFGFRPSIVAMHDFGVLLQQDPWFYYDYFPQERLSPQFPEIIDDGWMPDTDEYGQMIMLEFDGRGRVMVPQHMEAFQVENFADQRFYPEHPRTIDNPWVSDINANALMMRPELNEEVRVGMAEDAQDGFYMEFPEDFDDGWRPEVDENGSIIMPEFDEEDLVAVSGGVEVGGNDMEAMGQEFEAEVNEYEIEDLYSET